MGSIATVCKLKGTNASVVAGFNYLLSHFNVGIIKNRNDSGATDYSNGIYFLKLGHGNAILT